MNDVFCMKQIWHLVREIQMACRPVTESQQVNFVKSNNDLFFDGPDKDAGLEAKTLL